MSERRRTTSGPMKKPKRRRCAGCNKGGDACGAPPQRESELCFMHDPATAAEAANARKLGGLRRRRESTVAAAYDLEGIETIEGAQRLLEVATVDTLGLENSIARSRVIIQLVHAALRLADAGETEARLQKLEASREVGPAEPVVFPEGPDAH
jgi:hypothetical protein